MGGAPASQAGGRGCGGCGRDRRGGLHHLLQGGALPQRVQSGAAASWGKAGKRSVLVLHAVNDSTRRLVNTDCIRQSAGPHQLKLNLSMLFTRVCSGQMDFPPFVSVKSAGDQTAISSYIQSESPKTLETTPTE